MKVINLDDHPERKKKKREEETEKLLHKADTLFYIDKDYAGAEKAYQQAIDAFSERKAPAFAYEKLSDSYFMQNKLKESVSALEKCLEIYPDDLGIMVKLGMLHIDQFEEIRNPLKAVHYFKRIKTINPNFGSGCLTIDLMLMWAEIYADAGNQ